MSRCFFRELKANNITFLPEGLFDKLINLQHLWVNTSLFSFSKNLEACSVRAKNQPSWYYSENFRAQT